MSEPVERVTIRVQPGKELVYPEFKSLVTEKLGSDVCYVTTSLWEAFNQAIKSAPNPADPITLKFLRQHIQLNIGCNFNYNVRKSRRIPPPQTLLPEVQLDRNHILPGLLEMWPTLKPESKAYWRKRLKEAGVLPVTRRKPRTRKPKPTPPSVSTGAPGGIITKTLRRTVQCMTFVTGWSVGNVGAMEKRERDEYLAGRGEF